MGYKETKLWKLKNKKKVADQKKRHRLKYDLREITSIYNFANRTLKPLLIKKFKGCQFCKYKKNLEIHHIKYTKKFEDVLLLCRECHLNIHRDTRGVERANDKTKFRNN